jgi:hypothetical protein
MEENDTVVVVYDMEEKVGDDAASSTSSEK